MSDPGRGEGRDDSGLPDDRPRGGGPEDWTPAGRRSRRGIWVVVAIVAIVIIIFAIVLV
ncbi:hypothetical protein [Streptantibioticus cattleyicolor]|uniref:Uncharacterized protein n=1 Tax=Streptantibioticus cattleyicolor (strain ATCC 35852 / DSM 46488 / JCM 4925 / NBRC 14057 / NRRL 8057) TaxID=1003195 RepID=F8JM11_STREN